MFDARLPHLRDDWAVWAFSDPHGVTSGLRQALREAGLIDAAGHWSAAHGTALVGCGDYIDRGGDIPGTVALLQRLQAEAEAAGGAVIPALGNHESMLLMIRAGRTEWLETWLDYGGRETVAGFGCSEEDAHRPERAIALIERCQPGLFDWLETLPQAVRWRDVLFVHGGLAPDVGPADLGLTTEEHLWIRASFFQRPWAGPAFERYRHAGIGRVVFGHTPQWHGPTFYHDGRSWAIDTNAVGNKHAPADADQLLTLVGLAGSGTFEDATVISVPTAGAPDAGDAQGGR